MTHFLDGTSEDRPGFAAVLMLTALMLLAAQDAVARMTGAEMSFWQFQMLRAGCNVILLTSFAYLVLKSAPRRLNNPVAVGARVGVMVLATMFFFGGIPHVTIVEMAAGLYTFPIFVTLLSVVILGERVGIRRAGAVLVGAAGAMLILQPGGEEFNIIKILPIGAGFFYACNVIITRRWCRGENAISMALVQGVVLCAIGGLGCVVLAMWPTGAAARETVPYLAFGWKDAALWAFGATVFCSAFNAAGNVLLTKAYQSAESSWLAPFDYTYLIFATLVGYVLFGTLPGPWQALGVALIFAAGTFTAWRERRLKAQLAADLGTELPPPGNRA